MSGYPQPEKPMSLSGMLLSALLTCLLLGLGLHYAINVPQVLISVDTHKCVDVLGPTDGKGEELYSCSKMPERYEVVWVSGSYSATKTR